MTSLTRRLLLTFFRAGARVTSLCNRDRPDAVLGPLFLLSRDMWNLAYAAFGGMAPFQRANCQLDVLARTSNFASRLTPVASKNSRYAGIIAAAFSFL